MTIIGGIKQRIGKISHHKKTLKERRVKVSSLKEVVNQEKNSRALWGQEPE
jgi:hypothetical protein